jgi:hypothetical protein
MLTWTLKRQIHFTDSQFSTIIIAVNAGQMAILLLSASRLYVNYLDQLFNCLW